VNSDDLILVLHEEAKIKFSNISIPSAVSVVYLIIGPEGGISSEELNIFKSANANIVKLGEPVLRSAHAGIAALAAIQTKLGRW
jgi:16S rRNA (uracil1498-N3)-methyltransferase